MTNRRHLALRVAALLAIAAAPVAAFGQGTEEQQQACTPDAVKLCSDQIPDIPKTTACMKAHFAQLTPRCQAAFNDATGGAKATTKSAARKAEAPRTRLATRAERRAPERAAPPAPAPATPDTAVEASVPQVAGYPPFPSPDAPLVVAPASATPRSQLAAACRAGLIDSFTCRTTMPALLGAMP